MNVKSKTILIFDDDATFGMTMRRQALAMNVETIVCRTMEEFCLKALEGSYDIALIDFHLDYFKGDDVARVVENRPVVLMSSDKSIAKKSDWPKGIVGFVSKTNPARDVLGAALNFVA
ncbi:MAG: response regulator [Proteobacteria bacterium]|nr:response regulator [Pseudomonadota bacterium]